MKLEAAIAADYGNIAGMVVRKDGETVYERYFGGCTAESRLNVFSVTKSIVSILLGIALDRGCLGSIDQQAGSEDKGTDAEPLGGTVQGMKMNCIDPVL